MKKNDFFTFGKYKGKSLAYVLANDYQYAMWCQANVAGFYIDGSSKKIRMSTQEIVIREILKDMFLQHYEKNRKRFINIGPKNIRNVLCAGCKFRRLCNG